MLQRLKQLQQRQGFMRYFKNTSWLFAEKILRMIVGLLVGIWVARYLGPEQFGLFSYAQSFVGLFAAIAGLGLDGIIVRELVKDPSKQAILLGTAFRLKLIGALLVLIALAVAVKLSHQDSLTTLLIFIIASATVFQSFNVIDFYFQAKVLSKYIVYTNIVSLLISSIVKVALILNNAPLIAFAWVILFDSVVLMLGFVYVFQRYSKPQGELNGVQERDRLGGNIKELQFSKTMAVSLLKDSWPLILSGVTISIALRIDQVMIKEYLDITHVGYYSVGVRLAEVFAFIPMIIAQSLYPKIIEMDFNKDRRVLRIIIRRVFYLLVILAVTVNLLSKFVVILLFGQDFLEGYVVLDIIIWTIPFTYLGIITNKIFIINNEQKTVFSKQFALTICNIILNVSLIPILGLVGAALATLLSDIVINLFFELIHRKSKWIFFLKVEAITFIKVRFV